MSIKIAKTLKEIGAFKISESPYTWSSGIHSPFYCDNRILLSYPESWNIIIDEFCHVIRNDFPKCEALAGVATAGIPHASVIAYKMKLPMIYVRAEAKKHGKKNLIEGSLEKKGSKVLMIEDLISTGGSCLRAADAVRQKHEVLGVVSIFSYGLKKARENFKDISAKSLTNLSQLTSLFELSEKQKILIEKFKSEHCL